MRDSPEFRLIARIRDTLAKAGVPRPEGSLWIGDDAALTPEPGGVRVTSVDLCIEGTHFTREHSSPEQIGHKALAAALSDLAAMGATASEALITLTLPGFDEDLALGIARGIGRLAADEGVAISGGDIAHGQELALGVTVIGQATNAADLVTRGGAMPGDVVLVSGSLGAAAAGLVLLDADGESVVDEGTRARLTEAQLAPVPKLELGRLLAAGGASAMIDVSDGLFADAEQIATESGAGIEIDPDLVPLADGVGEVAARERIEPLEIAARGEDYELLACVTEQESAGLIEGAAEAGFELTSIGRVLEGSGISVRGRDGVPGGGYDAARAAGG